MALLTLLLALGLWQWTKAPQLIQKDNWFFAFVNKLSPANSAQRILIGIAVPALILAVFFALLSFEGFLSTALTSLATLIILIYSLGRGDWDIQVSRLRAAWHEGDGERALALVQAMTMHRVSRTIEQESDPSIQEDTQTEVASSVDTVNWRVQVMRALAYHGFERSFVVIFWFVLLSPIAAIVYRLSYLATQNTALNKVEARYAKQWLWLVEWPALRLLGLTFAFTGHFMGCIEHWRICVLCGQRSTQAVLSHYIQGALHIDSANPEVDPLACKSGFCDVVINLGSIVNLYSRTLLLWVCVITVFWVF